MLSSDGFEKPPQSEARVPIAIYRVQRTIFVREVAYLYPMTVGFWAIFGIVLVIEMTTSFGASGAAPNGRIVRGRSD